jgi:outer membrane receptor protein involved in Fe transport
MSLATSHRRCAALRRALLSSSVLGAALALAPAAAFAADAVADGGNAVEEVIVTGSRLVTDGTRAPTPVTVVSADQLQKAAPRSVTDALLQLPNFKGSVSVQSQGTGTTSSNGAAYLNLRGLGTQRTLVLVDGRRFVPASSAGSVDVALIPEALIQRVDVVTGGASAAYGSDAVAGVVNFVLDTHFKGFKGTVQGGLSDRADNANYKINGAWGGSFVDDRFHLVASGEHFSSDGVKAAQARDWVNDAIHNITNPNVTASNPASPTNPLTVVVTQPYSSIAALGGLITNTALRGTTFDPDGTARPFHYGSLVSSTQMSGGEGYNPGLLLTLQPRQQRDAAFGQATFDITPNVSVYAAATVARNHVKYNSLPTFELSNTAFTIFSDNAYLPTSVRAAMIAGNIPSVSVGRISPDFAIPHMDAISDTQEFTLGLNGSLGDGWGYQGYIQTGRNHANYQTSDDPMSDELYRAADAVVNPANGQIVCRSTLSDPNDGCVPLNIFGNGNASAAAKRYITGVAVQDVHVRQDVAEFSVHGDLFRLPAGPLAVAAGAGYRKEEFTQTVDPRSAEIRSGTTPLSNGTIYTIHGYPTGLINTLGGYERTNPQPTGGAYDVREVFAEAQAPLLADAPWAKSLTLNGAVRYTDYSTSGGVTSWKLGVVYAPVDGFTIRATRSRDIRAPNLGELYQGSSQGTSTVTDPQHNRQAVNALTGAVGNTALTPELSDTTVVGFIAQPAFLPGFSINMDYYDINIQDAISALTAQQEIDLCDQGATGLCGFIERNAAGTITRVQLPFFNVAGRVTRGVDTEASYSLPLSRFSEAWEGQLTFRALINYISKFETTVQGAAPLELAGDIGNSLPKWSGAFTGDLKVGRYEVFLQERWIGSGKYSNTLGPRDIDRNHADQVFYTDVTLTYDLSQDRGMVGFVTINNLFDRDPEPTPGFLIAGASFGNRGLYDLIGRTYTAGLRFRW